MASFPKASPPTPCAHLYPPPYAPHVLPISFVSILPPAQYWVRSTDHIYSWGYYSAHYICLLQVLCPLKRPITSLGCVLLRDNNRAPVAKLGPEINSQACLCTTRTTPQYQMLLFHPAFCLSFYILPRDPPRRLRSNKPLNSTVSCELVGDFIFSHTGMPRDSVQPNSV